MVGMLPAANAASAQSCAVWGGREQPKPNHGKARNTSGTQHPGQACSPSGPKSAQLKSSRSLMLTLMEVRCSTRPICSAMPMNLQGVHTQATLCDTR